jgi:hypothetical protein
MTNLKTPCRSGARNVTEYAPGWPGTGGSAVRMCGSSIVNSSCMSVTPAYGAHAPVAGSYAEMCAVYVCARRRSATRAGRLGARD